MISLIEGGIDPVVREDSDWFKLEWFGLLSVNGDRSGKILVSGSYYQIDLLLLTCILEVDSKVSYFLQLTLLLLPLSLLRLLFKIPHSLPTHILSLMRQQLSQFLLSQIHVLFTIHPFTV